jgi:DNA-binding transcriptional ArsR family regulator
MLYRAGIVDRRKDGASVYYRVVDPNFATICRTVCVQIASGEPHRNLRRPSRASLMKLSRALQAPVE